MAKTYLDFAGVTSADQVLEWEPWSPSSSGILLFDATPTWDDTPAVGLSGNSARNFVRLIDAPLSNNVEIYGLTLATDTGGDADIYVGGVSGYSAYKFDMRFDVNQEIRITKFVNGSPSFGVASQNFSVLTGDVVHVLCRWNANTGELKLKAWVDGAVEPTTWGIEITDTSLTEAGTIGLFTYNTDFYYSRIGIGTDNDSAPRELLTSTLGIPINQSTTNITTSAARFNWERG